MKKVRKAYIKVDFFLYVEITGSLGNQTAAGLVEILMNRYGELPRRLKALSFVTYIWEYDKSVLALSFIGFKLARPKMTKAGRVNYFAGNSELAARFIEHAVQMDPNSSSAYHLLGTPYP